MGVVMKLENSSAGQGREVTGHLRDQAVDELPAAE